MVVTAKLLLFTAAISFLIGVCTVISRKNSIVAFMGIEIMLNAVNLTFVTFSRANGNLEGQIAVFFVMVIAAAEAAIGLSLILSLFRSFNTVDSDKASTLKF
jgi:NADH-quinone oxidoreductase subunit K